MKGERADEGRLERDGELFGVDLDEFDEVVTTGGARIVPDYIVGGGLHVGCFKSENGSFAGDGSHEVSKEKRM